MRNVSAAVVLAVSLSTGPAVGQSSGQAVAQPPAAQATASQSAGSQTDPNQMSPPPKVPKVQPVPYFTGQGGKMKRAARPKPVPGQITVPASPRPGARAETFVDKHDGVSFEVPAGWLLSRKDGEVSTFHEDARSAPATTRPHAVAILDFNPFPQSTLSGALFYFSLEPKTDDAECAAQATGPHPPPRKDVQLVGSAPFAHGHDEHGEICTEARDEVYTTYHRHACYRFDLAINTFCAVSSGAQEITDGQLHKVNEQLTQILSSVKLKWEKAGPSQVPVPEEPPTVPGVSPKPMVPGVL